MYKGYKIIALCVTKLHNEDIYEFVSSLNKRLLAANARLLIFHTSTDLYKKTYIHIAESSVFELIPYDIVDYVITYNDVIQSKKVTQSIYEAATAHGRPVIGICSDYENAFNIKFEYNIGFEMVVEHLIKEHNITDINMIAAYEGCPFSDKRIKCFKEVLRKNGIEYDDSMLHYGGLWNKPTIALIERLVAEDKLPRAFMCVNDFTAITVCDALTKRGIRVPEDVVVAGIDGTREAGYSEISLTTAKCDISHAVDVVMDIINGSPEYKRPCDIDVEFALMKGHSCGCEDMHTIDAIGKLLKSSEERLAGYMELDAQFNSASQYIIMSSGLAGLCTCLDNLKLYNFSVVMNKSYFDAERNLMNQGDEVESFDEEMVEIFRDGVSSIDSIIDVDKTRLVDEFDDLLQTGRPLVVNSLCYLGQTLGYVCFYYDYDLQMLCHIPQIVFMLERAFGDYKNVQYLKNYAMSMEEVSGRDFMTALHNRKGFHKNIKPFLDMVKDDEDIIVASIDMDGLKRINDSYGHAAGDYSIKVIADAIHSIEVNPKLAARFGGDEFIMCTVARGDRDEERLKELFQDRLRMLQADNGKPYSVEASIGCVRTSKETCRFEDMIKESDKKMYADKALKPNRR